LRSLRHISALDGLRGAALLGVLFYHADGALRGGFLGVDLFFTLSGFLITSLLLAEHETTGRISLRAFWIRRARRLFPALLSLMPAIALYSRFVAKPAELAGLRQDSIATLAYVANWRTILSHKSYWDLFSAPSPHEHTWSLSIEEQFYVVWPLVVVLVLRRAQQLVRRRAIFGVAVALTALSIAAMIAFYDAENVSRAYLGTDTRAAAILAGAALACVMRDTTLSDRAIRALDVAGLASAIGLAVAWWTLGGQDPILYHGGFWLVQAAALVLIACSLDERSYVARAFSFAPLAFVGTISYGLYLWHWPVDVFLNAPRTHLHGLWLQFVRIAVTFAIATVSYRVLEKPIRTRGIFFGKPAVVVPAAIALAVFLVVRATHARQEPQLIHMIVAELTPVEFRVLVVGDSTANSLGWGLRGLYEPGVAIELHGRDGCTMLGDTCGDWAQDTRETKPNATLVFLGGAFLHGIGEGGRWRKSCFPLWDAKFENALTRRLKDLAPFGNAWAVTIPYPLDPYDTPDFHKEVDCINASIRRSATDANVKVLEFGERFCPNGICQRELDGIPIRPDGVHYRIEGMAELGRWILERIRSDAG